jgi:electron transport complex protein RnfD
MMQQVLLALVPAALAHVWFFGPGLIFNLLVATGACIGGEALMMQLRGRPAVRALSDYSALVTAALLAFALPSLTPPSTFTAVLASTSSTRRWPATLSCSSPFPCT